MIDLSLEDFRRELAAKRTAVGANTPLGHRYSTAIERRQHLVEIEKRHKHTLKEIAELELADII